jgi:hypothetical protein
MQIFVECFAQIFSGLFYTCLYTLSALYEISGLSWQLVTAVHDQEGDWFDTL